MQAALPGAASTMDSPGAGYHARHDATNYNVAIRARFEYDSSTIQLEHATTRYEVFRALAYEIDPEHSTRISGRRVLHVD